MALQAFEEGQQFVVRPISTGRIYATRDKMVASLRRRREGMPRATKSEITRLYVEKRYGDADVDLVFRADSRPLAQRWTSGGYPHMWVLLILSKLWFSQFVSG